MHLNRRFTKEALYLYALLITIVVVNLVVTYANFDDQAVVPNPLVNQSDGGFPVQVERGSQDTPERVEYDRPERPDPLTRMRPGGEGNFTEGNLTEAEIEALFAEHGELPSGEHYEGEELSGCEDCPAVDESVLDGLLPPPPPSEEEEVEERTQEARRFVTRSGCDIVVRSGDPADKLDLIFVGDGYAGYDDLQQAVAQLMGDIFTQYPFNTYRDVFNVWIIPTHNYPHNADGSPFADEYLKYVYSCERDTVVILSKEALYRSHAFFPTVASYGGVVFLSLRSEAPSFRARMLMHELGHAIGGLADEYVEDGLGDRPRSPNCAPDLDTAEGWWDGDYITGIQLEGAITFESDNPWEAGGCGYSSENIRSTEVSIMNNHRDTDHGYGPVAEEELVRRLGEFR